VRTKVRGYSGANGRGASPMNAKGDPMAIAVHVINTPKSDAREAYEAAWRRIDEEGLREPKGRQSHTAWMVGDVLHVLDLWDNEDDMKAWMQRLALILEETKMELAGPPETGELLQVVRPS
jgi:hypothetical protein